MAGIAFQAEINGGGVLAIFCGIMFFFIGCFEINENGKKQGQVDALTGNIYYKLQTNPDSTKEWVLIEKTNNY